MGKLLWMQTANSGGHIVWLDVTTAETIIQTMVILYNFNQEFISMCDTFEFCMWWVQWSGLVSEGSVFSHGGEAGKLLSMCTLMFWQQLCCQGLGPSGIFLDKPSTVSVVCLIIEVWLLIAAPSFCQMLMWPSWAALARVVEYMYDECLAAGIEEVSCPC